MGVLFVFGGANGALSPASTFALGLSSVWFFWSMAAVMAALTVWAPVCPAGRAGAVALTAASVLAPWVTAEPTLGAVAMSVVMVGWFLFLYRLLRLRQVATHEVGLVVGTSVAFLAMASGGFLVAATGGADVAAIVFGSVIGVHDDRRGRLPRPFVLPRVERPALGGRGQRACGGRGRALARPGGDARAALTVRRASPISTRRDSYADHINRAQVPAPSGNVVTHSPSGRSSGRSSRPAAWIVAGLILATLAVPARRGPSTPYDSPRAWGMPRPRRST